MKETGTTIICFVIMLALAVDADARPQSEQLDPLDLLFAESGEIKHSAKTDNVIETYPTDTNIIVKPAQYHSDTPPNYSNNFLWLSPANFISSLEQLSQENTSNNNKNIAIPADHNLIEAQIAVPVSDNKNQTSSTLRQMIEKVRSVKFEPKEKPSESAIKEEPTVTPEPENIEAGQSEPDVTKQLETESSQIEKQQQQAASDDTIDESILKQIELLTEHPEQAENPLLLAEVLALSGHHKQAAIMYSEAVKRSAEDQPLSIHDKAWLLLQTASCQKTYETEQALKTYKNLLEQCQGSPWTAVAQAQSDLLEWLQTEKPQELIELCKSELKTTVNQELGKQKSAQ